MKEQFQYLAKYNRLTNRNMMQILEKLSPEMLNKEMGSYYGSILGLVNHLLIADITWIRRMANLFPELHEISASLPDVHTQSSPEIIWKTLGDCERLRAIIDDAITKIVNMLQESQYDQRLTYKNKRGEPQSKIAWHILLHIFNHHTHHRGGIAVLLDQLKVDNDYSNIILIEP